MAPPVAAHAASVIVVDSASQGLGVTGCTLPEAILAANHDASVVPDPIGNGASIDTGCVAGSGIDVIELGGASYAFGSIIDEDDNHVGPTATPVVTSHLIIEGRGAVIQRTGSALMRAFAVQSGGLLDLREVHVKDFAARGGNGGNGGGGGGLGAGGAIYVHAGSLIVQWSTFEANSATGGNGGGRTGIGGPGGGGGGGLGGYGSGGSGGGGGGGGSRGNGGHGFFGADGGGGGGTVSAGDAYSEGGYRCGGDGETIDSIVGANGYDAGCAGGGGGGGADLTFTSGDGGYGGYGGGGGGGAFDDGDGGHGGFGGGGGGTTVDVIDGCGYCGGTGGDADFGGGGGAGPGGFILGGPGLGGTFGGDASDLYGGGGAGLGGAIFGHSASITVSNSTFTRNWAVRGVAGSGGFTGGGVAENGSDAGGAIFTVGGSLTVTNATIAGNESTGAGAGLVVYKPTTGETTSLVLRNTIVAANTGRDECYVLGGVATSGTNNLVTPHDTDSRTPCPTVTQTADPQLGALALNEPGRTPTMALAAGSPAIDTGNLAFAPLDDQRGVARPQGPGADIGAYEYVAPADTTAPTASPTQAPAANGAGWNTTDVTVTWNWADETGGSGIDAANCTTSSTSSGEGAALALSATCADLAGNVGSANASVKVDSTAPTVTCAVTPTYVVGGTPESGLEASVTDALSGPAASPVTTSLIADDIAAPGAYSKALTGSDVAGNSTTVECEYVVAYAFGGFLQPTQLSSYKRGSTIPIRFQLGDASGVLSDADAAALLSPTCLVFVTLDEQVKGCARYDAASDIFQFDVKTTKALGAGAHSIGILVTTVEGDVVNSDAIEVLLR
ncbi:MAG: hypothetical protein K0S05_2320 [Agromyces sp.]|nr:hypothetical protein [Agromyces sp.]